MSKIEFKDTKKSVKGWARKMEDLAGPPHRAVGKFEVMLAAAYAKTQAATHVITGSLKASGIPDSDFDGNEWTGSITYGGQLWKSAAPGPPHDPVDYAIYEQARGGDHDFLAPADSVFTDEAVETVLMEEFDA